MKSLLSKLGVIFIIIRFAIFDIIVLSPFFVEN
jgi:hypothetical protein